MESEGWIARGCRGTNRSELQGSVREEATHERDGEGEQQLEEEESSWDPFSEDQSTITQRLPPARRTAQVDVDGDGENKEEEEEDEGVARDGDEEEDRQTVKKAQKKANRRVSYDTASVSTKTKTPKTRRHSTSLSTSPSPSTSTSTSTSPSTSFTTPSRKLPASFAAIRPSRSTSPSPTKVVPTLSPSLSPSPSPYKADGFMSPFGISRKRKAKATRELNAVKTEKDAGASERKGDGDRDVKKPQGWRAEREMTPETKRQKPSPVKVEDASATPSNTFMPSRIIPMQWDDEEDGDGDGERNGERGKAAEKKGAEDVVPLPKTVIPFNFVDATSDRVSRSLALFPIYFSFSLSPLFRRRHGQSLSGK